MLLEFLITIYVRHLVFVGIKVNITYKLTFKEKGAVLQIKNKTKINNVRSKLESKGGTHTVAIINYVIQISFM